MSDANDIPLEAVEFLRKASDAESTDRSEQLEDLKFSLGDQWVQQMQNQRTNDHRPWFTLNETDTYIRQVSNQMRQQRPRIKAQGVNSSADAKIAEIITGITRHIEQISDADTAYDNAGESAARIGVGYWRVSADYCSDESFDQEIKIEPLFNRFSVYFDPLSVLPDGSDAERALITDLVQKEDYQRMYPDADMTQFNARATGDSTSEWITKDTIRLAEFYKIEREKRKLVHLSDGSAWWDDEMPKADILAAVGVKVKGDRQSWRKKVCWYKVNAVEVLDERVLPGRYIPIIPVYGAQAIVDGRIRRFGIVRAAKDPQRLLNFMKTAVVETVALAPKAKHLVAYGSDTGFENEWDSANIASLTRLHYNSKGDDGEDLPPPIPIPPPPVPDGFLTVAENAHNDLQRVLGMFDPAMNAPGNQSGKALNSMQQQSDMSNYHLYDNLTRSIKHTGRIVLDWIPTYYNKRRVMRIIGDDGKPDMVTINDDQAVGKIENDLTVGEYDVVMETGPGYNSKREQASEMLSQLAKAYPPLMQIAGDLIMRYTDIPGADIIADRMAASNPLAQIDEKSDIPPRAQMMIKQLQAQLQQSQQQLQQAGMLIKERGDLAAHKEAGETHRTELKERAETERTRMKVAAELQKEMIEDRTWQHDINMKAHSAQSVEEIKGVVQLLLHHLSAKEAEKAADREEAEIDKDATEA